MARNYQPTLRKLLHIIAVFIARYRTSIQAGMTTDEATALATFEAGLVALQTQLGDAPVVD